MARNQLFAILLCCALVTCGARPGGKRIALWVHSGPGPERYAYGESVKAFNASQREFQVDLTVLPEGSYNAQVHAAAIANQLPALLEFDGPFVYDYAWAGKLLALDGFQELEAARRDMLPTLIQQGTFNGRLFTLGQYESGLALWGNRELLGKAGIPLPGTVEEAWTLPRFERVLRRLKRSGVPFPLDMKFNYGAGEWFTFGFAPLLQSMGGDLVEPLTCRTAEGFLNGAGSIRAMTLLQGWVKAGYINASTRDDADFIKGRSALSYVGHWAYGTYQQALGRRLVLIPMPRFGERAVTGAGSWNFGISATCKDPRAAAKLLAFLMSPPEITRVTRVNGAMPGTFTTLRASSTYGPGGPLAIYADQVARGLARVRPKTPAYPIISSAFAEAVNNILAGADVKAELDRAAAQIDEDLDDNKGYPAIAGTDGLAAGQAGPPFGRAGMATAGFRP